jgi:aminopeptidase N
MDLFDRHLYEKGGIVLNMLLRMLGESLFWKGVRRYVITNRSANVVTADLQKAFELATGRNLDWFFDQWVYGAGHPQLKASYEWDEDAKTARVTLKQTQSGDQVAQAFRLPLTIDFRLESGERPSFRVEMTEREQTFHLRPGAKPRQVRIDPGGQALKEIELDLSEEMLRDLLQWNDDVFTRVDAARALGRKGSREAVAALGRSLREDAFWGVQAEAAKALGAVRTAAALDELLASTAIAHPKARRAVMTALGEFREERAAEALERVIDVGDESYYVEAAAAAAIGKTRSGRAPGALERALARPSFAEVVRSNALAGLGELRDERGVALCIDWSRWGRPNPVRGAAVASLGKLGEWVSEARKSEIVDHVTQLLDDPWLRTRLSAVGACQELKEERALPHLDRVAESDLDGRVVRAAREAARAIREGKDRGDELKKLREEVEKLQEENRGLKDRLDRVEARLAGGGG